METINLTQLATVTGGADGRFEQLGGQTGETLGRWGAQLAPAPLRPAAQMVLPPAGRSLGAQAGRFVDNLFGR